MKKRLLAFLAAGALVLGLAGMARAVDTATQVVTVTVAEIAVIDVTGGGITLAVVAPAVGGDLPADVTDSTAYLQYTSNGTNGTSRKVTAAIGVATPATYDLKLLAAAPTGTGTVGNAQAVITLTAVAQDIITGIKDCNTGTGGTDGSNITYTVTCVTMPAVDAGTAHTVTYTLTDAA